MKKEIEKEFCVNVKHFIWLPRAHLVNLTMMIMMMMMRMVRMVEMTRLVTMIVSEGYQSKST